MLGGLLGGAGFACDAGVFASMVPARFGGVPGSLIRLPGSPIRGGARQSRACRAKAMPEGSFCPGLAAAPAHDHVTARADRMRRVPPLTRRPGTRRGLRGLVPARCTPMLHPRVAPGPSAGPPAPAASVPIHRGRARQRAPPADTGDPIVRRIAALHHRNRRRTARVPPPRPDLPGADGGGRAGCDGRSPGDQADAFRADAFPAHASWSRASWSAVRLPPFTRPPPRPSRPRASGVPELRTE